MRPHLMNGQMLQRHQHYHQAWICTINFRDLVSILSSWLAGLNSNVMPQNRIFCLLATTHGKNSYWGISYNSGYESDILSMFIELYQKKNQGRSPFFTLKLSPEFDFGYQTPKSDNFIELSISCTLGLRSHSTPFCTTSPWFCVCPYLEMKVLLFYGQLVRPKTHQNELV